MFMQFTVNNRQVVTRRGNHLKVMSKSTEDFFECLLKLIEGQLKETLKKSKVDFDVT